MDPVADLLIRIKNGYLARKTKVVVPYSKLRENLVKILVDKGYLAESKKQTEKGKKTEELVLTLKYEGKKPVLDDVQRVSKPGLRVYAGKGKIPKVLGGLGIAIVSTSKGLITDEQARKNGLGGEIVCKIW